MRIQGGTGTPLPYHCHLYGASRCCTPHPLLAENKVSVIATTETWLDSSATMSEVNIDGPSVLQCRNRQGSGVCVYVKSYVSSRQINNVIKCHWEVLWIELLSSGRKLIRVRVCYRPADNTFLDKLDSAPITSDPDRTPYF